MNNQPRILRAIITALTLFIILPSFGQSEQGSLFIIGGGKRPDAIVKEMVKTAELRPNDYIVILPMASSKPIPSAQDIAKQMGKFTGNHITTLSFNERNAGNKTLIDSLSKARLVYILGGSQRRFMKVVLNTPIYEAIHTAFNNGGTIAGTSAGAAVMSEVMITGGRKIKVKDEKGFPNIWFDHVETARGLGLLPSRTIIDQHFSQRNRQNRLISVLADFPEYKCIGIDESTAIVCKGNEARVVGKAQVTVIADPVGLERRSKRLVTFKNIDFALFADGDSFQVR